MTLPARGPSPQGIGPLLYRSGLLAGDRLLILEPGGCLFDDSHRVLDIAIFLTLGISFDIALFFLEHRHILD